MKFLIFITTIILLCSCCQNNSADKVGMLNLPERIAYVDNPNSTDKLCITEIERAKKDVQNGKIVFTQSAGFLFGDIRYEDELRQLCKKYDLVFDFDLIGCVVIEGQTQGCYGDYMDKIIWEKYGSDFKEQLHAQADSLFLVNANLKNKVVKCWDCDERPRLSNETKRTSDYLPEIKVSELDIKKKKGEYGGWPFLDLGFIVERDSTISGFYSNNFVAELAENEKYEKEMFSIAVKYIKKNYPLWVPGKVKGTPVRTDNNVRIFFVNEKSSSSQ